MNKFYCIVYMLICAVLFVSASEQREEIQAKDSPIMTTEITQDDSQLEINCLENELSKKRQKKEITRETLKHEILAAQD